MIESLECSPSNVYDWNLSIWNPGTTATYAASFRGMEVSFEDLVRVVTYPQYDIDDPQLFPVQVGYLLAKAALGKVSDWKAEKVPTSLENAGKDIGIQPVVEGSKYCYYSPDKEHWEWKMCSSKGWPVWVKDAEEWKEKISERCDIPSDVLDNFAGTDLITRCAYVCDPIKETIDETYGNDAYNNYLLTVKFGGAECEGLSGYGVANYSRVRTAITNPAIPASYIATCIAGQGLCMALKVGSIVGAGSAFLDGVLGGTHCIVEGAIMGALQYISANYGGSWIGTSGEVALPTEIAYLFAAGPVAQKTGRTTIPIYRPGRIADRLQSLEDAKIKYDGITSNLRDKSTFQTLKSDTEAMVRSLKKAGIEISDSEIEQVEKYAGDLENLGAEKTKILQQLREVKDETDRTRLLKRLTEIDKQIEEVSSKYNKAIEPIVEKLEDAEKKLKKAQTTCTAIGSTAGAVAASITAAVSYAATPENILKVTISTCDVCTIQANTEKICVSREGGSC